MNSSLLCSVRVHPTVAIKSSKRFFLSSHFRLSCFHIFLSCVPHSLSLSHSHSPMESISLAHGDEKPTVFMKIGKLSLYIFIESVSVGIKEGKQQQQQGRSVYMSWRESKHREWEDFFFFAVCFEKKQKVSSISSPKNGICVSEIWLLRSCSWTYRFFFFLYYKKEGCQNTCKYKAIFKRLLLLFLSFSMYSLVLKGWIGK